MKSIKTAEILCVGTELLLGEVINTNAATISRELATLGVSVYHHSVVGDNPERLRETLIEALDRSDLVVMSGGLGPTYDDLTKETVAEVLGRALVTHEPSLAAIKGFFASRAGGLCAMTPNNLKQALIPEGATVFDNPNGTAPGLAVEREDGKTVILLPGPPRELTPMMRDSVIPYLEARTESVLVSHNIHILGMGESAVENLLRPLMEASENPTVAPYAGDGEVRLRVTAKAATRAEAEALIGPMIQTIRDSAAGQYIYGIDVGSIERALVEELKKRRLTISTAESCTGGLIAKRLTDIPGASAVFAGSCVTYTGAAKMALLGVGKETLAAHSEVSRETAEEMARGARERFGTDLAISTTGYAGPGGGTEDDPVGTVYVGISTPGGETVRRLSLSPMRSRDFTRTVAASRAMAALMETILEMDLRG